MPRPFLAAVLALPLCAQAPYDHLVVANRSASAAVPGMFFLDPDFGAMTPVRVASSTSVATGYRAVAFDAAAPDVVYTLNALSTSISATVQVLTLNGNQAARSGIAVNLSGAQPVRMRDATGFGLLILGRGNTGNRMFLRDMATGTVTPQPSPGLLPGLASDLVVIGSRAYAAAEGSSTGTVAGAIVEWDLAANTDRLVGAAYPPITALASLGGALLAGDAAGSLHIVDPATGSATLFLATGLGRIASIAVGAAGRVFFATNPGNGSVVFEVANLGQPLFRTTGLIDDLKTSPWPVPTMLTFGSGCPGTNGQTPVLGHAGMPALGTTFQVSVANAPATTGALLVLGSSRVADGFGPLPRDLGAFGMPGCEQAVDAQATVFVGVSGGGGALAIAVPANPALAGVRVPMQWLVIDPGVNAVGATVSSAGEAHLR